MKLSRLCGCISLCVVFLGLSEVAGAGWKRIAMEGNSPYYVPPQAEVTSGNPILWVNRSGSPHTVTHVGCLSGKSCAFDSGSVAPEKTFEISLLPPGHYRYACRLHPIMQGELIVVPKEPVGKEAQRVLIRFLPLAQ